MANKFSDLLLSIHNTQIRTALERMFGIIGVAKGDYTGSCTLEVNLTGNVTGNITGDISGDVTGTLTNTAVGDQRTIDIQITPTTDDRQLYMDINYTSGKEAAYIISSSASTTGSTTAIRARGQGKAVGAATSAITGVHAQGIAFASLYSGTVNALYAEAISKTASTVTTIRGAMIACDSEGTPTSIGTMIGAHVRVKTSVEPATSYVALLVQNERFLPGWPCDAGIRLSDPVWEAAETAFTIGLDIATTSIVTTGINISSPTVNGIVISGASSTAQISLIHTLAAPDDNCLLVTSSSTSTNGSVSQAPVQIDHTMTGVGAVGGRAEFNTTFNGVGLAGGWTNALKGNFTFGASATGGTGLHSAVCAEMTVPNTTVGGGFFSPLEIELNIPASHVPQDKQLTMMTMSPNTTPATFDTYGTVMALQGVTVGAGKVFDTCTAGAASHALRISIAGTYYYIMLQDNVDA